MPKLSRFPQAGLLLAAAGLVIVCQLVAVAMVADKQVQRAGVRDLQRVAQQASLADCIQRSTGANRHGCIRQSQLESDSGEPAVATQWSGPASNASNVAIADDLATNQTADIMRVGAAATR